MARSYDDTDEEEDDDEDDDDEVDEPEGDDEVDDEEPEEAVIVVRKKRKAKGKKKDPSMPKRNMSAFFLYSQAHRSQVKEDNPGSAFGDIVSLCNFSIVLLD
jgi:HMG (high mobility group) box